MNGTNRLTCVSAPRDQQNGENPDFGLFSSPAEMNWLTMYNGLFSDGKLIF